MQRSDIALARLQNHHLDGGKLTSADSIVEWMGAMQAQEYEQAKWAVGSRLPGSALKDIEFAISKKTIVRTWLLRGTLHFVSAKDVHWMLELVAPGIIPRLRARHEELGLKENQFELFYSILTENLQGGKELSRTELTELFQEKGIDAKGPRLYHILLKAALDQIICCGKKNDLFRLLGKGRNKMSREDSLKQLAKKYYFSHGPATTDDFATWAGIPLKDARNGTEAAGRALHNFQFENKIYWHGGTKNRHDLPECMLLAGFDEYYLGYKEKNITADSKHVQHIVQKNGIFNPVILIDGYIYGIWKRTFQKGNVIIELFPFKKFNKRQKDLVMAAAERFGNFIGRDLQIKS